ncbi:hypothetical protein, partial [Streptomyces griseus]|uniref:hypothetical protein n=1 Tax=Streptomyces griseus TaxID=1911 RepID=UPI0036AC4A7E
HESSGGEERGGGGAGDPGTDAAPATGPAGAAHAPAPPEDLGSLSFHDLVRAVQADVRAERTENS